MRARTYTDLQNKIMEVLINCPSPLQSARDVACIINRKYLTEYSAFGVGASLGSLRTKRLVTRRKVFRRYPQWACYHPPGGYQELWPYTTYWFMTNREIEVYPIGAKAHFRKDLRR